MRDYGNILDFFQYIKELNLCTTPFCSTCGAMEYRRLCKELGHIKIKELVEATSIDDLSKVHPSLWYNPLHLLLYDGFRWDLMCPIMELYEKGYDWLVWGDSKELLMKIGNFKAYSVVGSIFEEKHVDVLALFENPGLSALPILIRSFLHEKELGDNQRLLIPCEGKHGDVKAVYYAKTAEANHKYREIANIIHTMLNTVSQARYSSIAMNGIRTLGYSELDNCRIIKEWILTHPDTSINTILLIDKRAGFNKLIHRDYYNYTDNGLSNN